jgi:hypothetical protein
MSKNTIQVGDMPIEADTIKSKDNRNRPTTNIATTTPSGTHVVDTHHATIKKDHIVHTGDKQPTELHEPKAEKNYKLRDDEKDYEFKPRTEYTKTKDSKLSAWEGHGHKDHRILVDDHRVHDHGVHDRGVHEHVHKHGDEHDHKHGDQEKPGVIEKVKEVKEKVKDKVKEHKQQKEHESKLHGEHKPHGLKHEERVKPAYEETEYKKVEVGKFKPGYEETEFKRVEEKEVPYVSVGKGPVEIIEPRHEKEYKYKDTSVVGKEPVEIHEPREEKEFKLKDEDNVHVKVNFNKT